MERMTRVFAWPRSPSRMMSCPARMAFSNWGTTVSSKPSTPGTRVSPAAIIGRVAPHLLGHRHRLPARGAQIASAPGRSAGGLRSPGPGGRWRGRCGKSRPWTKPKPRAWASSAATSGVGPRRTMAGQELVGQGARRSGQRPVAPLGQGHRAAQCRRREPDGDQRAVARQRDGGHHRRPESGGHEGEDPGHLGPLADEMRFHPCFRQADSVTARRS